jgi:hypothetical protein
MDDNNVDVYELLDIKENEYESLQLEHYKLQAFNRNLIDTIETLTESIKSKRHINCKLFKHLNENINKISKADTLLFLKNGKIKEFIESILFKDSFYPLVKWKTNQYLYTTEYNSIGVISFEQLSKCLFEKIDNVLNIYLKCVFQEAEDEMSLTLLERNFRTFTKTRTSLLKELLQKVLP